jgi:hypothetical protein
VKLFGKDVLEALALEPQRLPRSAVLDPGGRDGVVESALALLVLIELAAELAPRGLGPLPASALVRALGRNARGILLDEPLRAVTALAGRWPGGFGRAAGGTGVWAAMRLASPADPSVPRLGRAGAGILATLSAMRSAGDAPVPEARLREAAAPLMPGPDGPGRAEAFREGLEGLIRASEAVFRLPPLPSSPGGRLVLLPESARELMTAETQLAALVSSCPREGIPEAGEALEAARRLCGFPLDPGQERAVAAVCGRRAALVTGPRRSGKKLVASVMARLFLERGVPACLVSVTRRGASALSRASGIRAATLSGHLRDTDVREAGTDPGPGRARPADASGYAARDGTPGLVCVCEAELMTAGELARLLRGLASGAALALFAETGRVPPPVPAEAWPEHREPAGPEDGVRHGGRGFAESRGRPSGGNLPDGPEAPEAGADDSLEAHGTGTDDVPEAPEFPEVPDDGPEGWPGRSRRESLGPRGERVPEDGTEEGRDGIPEWLAALARGRREPEARDPRRPPPRPGPSERLMRPARLSGSYGASGSMLPGAVAALRQGRVPQGSSVPDGDFFWLEGPDEAELARKAVRLIAERVPKKLGVDARYGSLALCGGDAGPLGVTALHEAIHLALCPEAPDGDAAREPGGGRPADLAGASPVGPTGVPSALPSEGGPAGQAWSRSAIQAGGRSALPAGNRTADRTAGRGGLSGLHLRGRILRPGERVFQTADNPDFGLVRGDRGTLVSAGPGSPFATVSFGDREVRCGPDELGELMPCWALPAWDAPPWASFPAVVMALGSGSERRLDRAGLVRAASLAERLLVIIALPKACARVLARH